jgi:hypothetical protein
VRLVQVRSSTEFREQRAGLARDLTTADGSIENAATWVQQQVEQGVPELIH